MKLSDYSYHCSNILLKMIATLSNEKEIIEIYDDYNKLFEHNKEVDIKWMLISTSLLMSEGLFKNEKVYNYISEKTIKEIEEKLFSYERYLPGESINKPYLLDRNNKSALSFRDFLKYPSYENENYEYLDDVDINIYKRDKYYESYKKPTLIDGDYGCNDSIMSEGLIDIKKLIIRVRNALAHSNYEIINKDNIRLYHYNRKEKRLDFNVILDTNIIINIVDELNEIAYKKYNEFNKLYFKEKYIDEELVVNENANDEDFINYIMNFEVCDRSTAEIIYDKAINSKLYKTLTYDDREYSKDKKKYFDNYNKMTIIVEFMYEYIKPYCDFGIIINNIMYTDENGKITSDEFYIKYDLYDYLKSDFNKIAYSDYKDEEYKNNMISFLILTFLNASFLTAHNEYENNNLEYIKFDFSNMEIDENIKELFTQKHINSNDNQIIILNEKMSKIENDITNKSNILENKKILLKNIHIDNDYFNKILPLEIEKIELEILELKKEKNEILNKINIISNNRISYNYRENLSDYIFKSIRNSLAHGNVKINNDAGNGWFIVFEDYNPDDKTNLTFRGKIKIIDLFKVLTLKDTIDELYNIGNIRKNILKKSI